MLAVVRIFHSLPNFLLQKKHFYYCFFLLFLPGYRRYFYWMSGYEGYVCLDISRNSTAFEFISTGPKGDIRKVIQFVPMRIHNVFNLAFGDRRADGTIDDNIISDNKDRNKILATVGRAVLDYTQRYPDRYVYFMGSSPERNRLYRMAISTRFDELSKFVSIWVFMENNTMEPFQKQSVYTGFLAKGK